MAQKKYRADQLAFMQGLTPSKEQAKRLIMAGEVFLLEDGGPGGVVDKPGHLYGEGTLFFLRTKERFVSRGAYKLLTLLEATSLSVDGLVCLDCGASTGGFTDCLLQHGAAKVYAIDVGHNQLHEKLRRDPRVISREGVNLRCPPADLIPELVDLLVADVSFISLTLVLPPCLGWLRHSARLALLIKPQFELGPNETVRGVVKDAAARERACEKIVTFCRDQLDLRLLTLLPSKITGPKGNQEYMALFERRQISS
ncbi:MAG: TlyA family RNA methyltransferase [Desulfovibrio sp.]|nr:TlyA family RNA methyltransferase [Desulfovibrio sp.]